jgi:hypothetical protein
MSRPKQGHARLAVFEARYAMTNPSIEGTHSGLRPPCAPHVKRQAAQNTGLRKTPLRANKSTEHGK